MSIHELHMLTFSSKTIHSSSKNPKALTNRREKKQKRLFYLFQRDFLGSLLGNQLLDNKMLRDAYHYHSENYLYYSDYVSSYHGKKLTNSLLIFLICCYAVSLLFIIGYIIYFAFLSSYQIQKAWISSILIFLLTDILILANLDVLIIHVGFPSLIYQDIKGIKEYILAYLEKQAKSENSSFSEGIFPAASSSVVALQSPTLLLSPSAVELHEKLSSTMQETGGLSSLSSLKKKKISLFERQKGERFDGSLSPPRHLPPTFRVGCQDNEENSGESSSSENIRIINSLEYFFISSRIARYYLTSGGDNGEENGRNGNEEEVEDDRSLEVKIISCFNDLYLPVSNNNKLVSEGYLRDSWLLRSYPKRISSSSREKTASRKGKKLSIVSPEASLKNNSSEASLRSHGNGIIDIESSTNSGRYGKDPTGGGGAYSLNRRQQNVFSQNSSLSVPTYTGGVSISIFSSKSMVLAFAHLLSWFFLKPFYIQDLLIQWINTLVILGLLWIHFSLYLMMPYLLALPAAIVTMMILLFYLTKGVSMVVTKIRKRYGRSLLEKGRKKRQG
jgi:biotin transporter BioY